jgi:VWFA-related protein
MATKMTCSVVLAASALFAQAPPGLVRLNLAALDSSGAPVDDLKVADLQVSDQGKAEKIVFFRQNAGAPPSAPLAPGEFSNRTGATPHSTVILFDLLNQNQTDRLDAWHKLGRSLQQLESGDSIYLYLLALEGNLIPIHEIGGKAGDDKTWTQQVEKTLDKAMKAASHARPTQMNDEELVVKKTYVALETLANQLAGFPGRRDIVWITNMMPNVWNTKTPCNGDWVDCALYVPHLAVTLASDNTSVNPLSYTSSPSPAMTRDLEQIGLLTGGSSYFGDEIRSVLTQIARDASHSYSIFYETSPENWDRKWHKIRVTAERKTRGRTRPRRSLCWPQHSRLPTTIPASACARPSPPAPIQKSSRCNSGSIPPTFCCVRMAAISPEP